MCKEYLPGGSGQVGGINFGDPLDLFGGQRRRDARAQQEEAKRLEAERQARITSNVQGINSAFAGRVPQYEQFGGALREDLNTRLGKERDTATRGLKFSLARSGLTGGSAAVDAGKNLAREGQEAAVDVERRVRGAVADLQGRDEQARTQLISLAQSGNDIGNAAQQSASMLRANLGAAQGAANVNNLGDLFGRTAATVRTQADAAARRRGLSEASTYARAFSRG